MLRGRAGDVTGRGDVKEACEGREEDVAGETRHVTGKSPKSDKKGWGRYGDLIDGDVPEF